jgi:hypothetical protein
MPACGVEVERDIFAFQIQLCISCGCEALQKRGFAFEPMGELPRREHRYRVGARRPAKSGIERQARQAGFRSGLIH